MLSYIIQTLFIKIQPRKQEQKGNDKEFMICLKPKQSQKVFLYGLNEDQMKIHFITPYGDFR